MKTLPLSLNSWKVSRRHLSPSTAHYAEDHTPTHDLDPLSGVRMIQPLLIAGHWQEAKNPSGTFHSENPATGEQLPEEYPISTRVDWDRALTAAVEAATALRQAPAAQLTRFLTLYADRIAARANELIETAHAETALPKSPRLKDIELPRTIAQLRQAAAAALEGTWSLPTIDTKPNIRSYLAPLGPILIFGPNNFPFAFNAVSGGDFAAAIAAGNPVIAKAHPSHPGTTCILAEEALAAAQGIRSSCRLPSTDLSHHSGCRPPGCRRSAPRRSCLHRQPPGGS